ncbi:PREDICTED: probable protein phosphatase 2C 28 isoform X2 [Camelina sativa]|uniref:Probable protein phosphatase 2C 28 isoform X2 n=1 Tax=Camelina sativa TaxID=90675 RepID=A0ABM0ZJI5_CAMSA|nr:PREDICTED: probable protein phosphatase 2C 28 isoform X2 [Camelina sativa]
MEKTIKNSTHSPEKILVHAVKEKEDHLRVQEETPHNDVVVVDVEDDDCNHDLVDVDDNADDDEENERYCKREFDHGYHLVKGQMGHSMEDYIVADTKTVKGHNIGLYAIFDGHSGREVADYLQNHLFDNILSQPDFWRNPKKAIKRAYKSTDDYILHNVVGPRGGSTAVTAIVIDGKKIVVANVGDSRAILCRESGVVKQVTVDHEPEKERDLVESRGGFVYQEAGNVPRVDGQLAMTRAFGDGRLKEHISVTPNVEIVEIHDDAKFLILASDGLWKVMSNEDVWDQIKKRGNAEEAARTLIDKALARGSTDDISCVVVSFLQSID